MGVVVEVPPWGAGGPSITTRTGSESCQKASVLPWDSWYAEEGLRRKARTEWTGVLPAGPVLTAWTGGRAGSKGAVQRWSLCSERASEVGATLEEHPSAGEEVCGYLEDLAWVWEHPTEARPGLFTFLSPTPQCLPHLWFSLLQGTFHRSDMLVSSHLYSLLREYIQCGVLSPGCKQALPISPSRITLLKSVGKITRDL